MESNITMENTEDLNDNEMKFEFKDFVGYYYNVYPQGYCSYLIELFDLLEKKGAGSNRQRSENAAKHIKDDYQIGLNLENNVCSFNLKDNTNNLPLFISGDIESRASDLFFDGLQACYNNYSEKYSTLKCEGNIIASTMKMQRTGPGGGYHVFHHEQGPNDSAKRVVVYMLYLNSLEDNEGGETEFLHQKTRIKPQENLMLLWPASYTHVHRGNPVLCEKSKYIVTGWFYYD